MADSPTISAISFVPGQTDRARVYVGKRAVATLSMKAIHDLRLAIGQSWDEATAAKVKHAVAQDRARRDAMRMVNRRMLSRSQLARKLRDKGHEAELVERVVEHLRDIGAVDDEALGRELIRQLRARKPAGPALLRQKLRQRGLDNSLIEQLLRQNADEDPVASARELARQALRRLSRAEPIARKRRLWGVLARRGFDHDTITQALEHLPELAEPDCDAAG